MLYFAYGSNMLKERLRHPRRVPGARRLRTGYVTGRKLAFHKRSWDGSGKCDLAPSDNPADRVYGVLYEVPDNQVAALDQAEALGAGYRRKMIEVFSDEGESSFAATYLADPNYIDTALAPYDWYKQLVLQGALQNGFPEQVINHIYRIPAAPDPEPNRITAIEAAEALKAFQATFPSERR